MNIEELRKENWIILEAIMGSHAYGTATETSDIDKRGIYIQPLDSILGFGYIEQISDSTNDQVFYEIRRFLELLQTNNPTVLELLSTPEDCIIFKDPIFDLVIDNKEKFITRLCSNSFGFYAISQIKKARGMNKKIVNPVEPERKGILDFCYVAHKQGSMLVGDYLKINYPNATYKDVGLVAIEHMRYTYGAYLRTSEEIQKYGSFRGIVSDPETSNDIVLSDTEKYELPKFIVQVNLDGYSTSCKKYKEYFEWVEKRNPQRYADNIANSKNYDGKNIAHCHRLLDMAIEIISGKGINVRRDNREELLAIRRGEREYDDLIQDAERKIQLLDELSLNSTLPKSVDKNMVNNLLLKIRKERYGLVERY